ncbi:MAG: uracil-DNA glycosylase [Eggerthellaceae bacterium]|jgi:DNA polymerase
MHKPHIPLDELRAQVEQCHRCPLAEGRTQTVFGDGNPSARILIVGEAPGKNEDLKGVPFVGAAGHKLDALLEIAGLAREDVFIANVLKCRPPGNRDPRPEEIEVCTPFLREQTRTIDPEFIVTLGNFATKFILKTDRGITHLHGRLQHAGKFKVFPIYHPAAAIYDHSKQEALEDDFATLGELVRQSDAEKAAAAEAAREEAFACAGQGKPHTGEQEAAGTQPTLLDQQLTLDDEAASAGEQQGLSTDGESTAAQDAAHQPSDQGREQA